MPDMFALPYEAEPEGWEYQWRRIPELGRPSDAVRWEDLMTAGFTPFLLDGKPVDRHGMRLLRRRSEDALTKRIEELGLALDTKNARLREVFRYARDNNLEITAKSSFDDGAYVVAAGPYVAIVWRNAGQLSLPFTEGE